MVMCDSRHETYEKRTFGGVRGPVHRLLGGCVLEPAILTRVLSASIPLRRIYVTVYPNAYDGPLQDLVSGLRGTSISRLGQQGPLEVLIPDLYSQLKRY
jgi:hypothetical protein